MNAGPRRFDLDLPHGIRLACRAAGQGAKRVVLLHGFPEAAFVWDEVMALVGERARCVAPNLRGFGGSSRPADLADYRAKHLIGDVAALIRQLGAPIDLLVAHDWGGALAWGLAATQPQLLKRLLIINAPHPATFLRELRDSPAQQAASAYMNFYCRPDAAERLAENDFERMWRSFAGAAWLTEPLRDTYRDIWRQGLHAQLNYYRASPLRPPLAADDAIHTLVLPDELVTVRVPTTVLWGERDHALLTGLLVGLEHWVPQLELRRVPEATHWIVHEQSQRVADEIGRLLDRD